MSENYVPESLCAARQQIHDERAARDKERLDKMNELVSQTSECVIKLSAMVEAHNTKLEDHENRLEKIEGLPGEWVNKAILALIAAAVAFVAGLIFP